MVWHSLGIPVARDVLEMVVTGVDSFHKVLPTLEHFPIEGVVEATKACLDGGFDAFWCPFAAWFGEPIAVRTGLCGTARLAKGDGDYRVDDMALS